MTQIDWCATIGCEGGPVIVASANDYAVWNGGLVKPSAPPPTKVHFWGHVGWCASEASPSPRAEPRTENISDDFLDALAQRVFWPQASASGHRQQAVRG